MHPTDPIVTLVQQLRAREAVPDSYIVVSPELHTLTASNAYLADTLKRRVGWSDISGHRAKVG